MTISIGEKPLSATFSHVDWSQGNRGIMWFECLMSNGVVVPVSFSGFSDDWSADSGRGRYDTAACIEMCKRLEAA